MARATFALVLAMAVAAVGVGCGGDGDGGAASSGTSLPSKAEFVKRANAFCRGKIADLGEEVSRFVEAQRAGKPRPVLIADLAHLVLLPPIEEQLGQVEEFVPPPGEEGKIDRMFSAEQYALDRVATTLRIDSIEAVYQPFAKSANWLREYGLVACANGPERAGAGVDFQWPPRVIASSN